MSPSKTVLQKSYRSWEKKHNPPLPISTRLNAIHHFLSRLCPPPLLGTLCPHQPIKQGPRQDEPRQPAAQPARPQLPGAAKVAARVPEGLARGDGRGGDADGVEEGGGQEGEDDVEEEAVVGLEAQDAGGDAEEGGR